MDFQELKFFGFVYQLVLEEGWRREIREKKKEVFEDDFLAWLTK